MNFNFATLRLPALWVSLFYAAFRSRVTRWRSTIIFTHVQVTSHSLRVSETKFRHLATLFRSNRLTKRIIKGLNKGFISAKNVLRKGFKKGIRDKKRVE